jgi:hypothetical protein
MEALLSFKPPSLIIKTFFATERWIVSLGTMVGLSFTQAVKERSKKQ